MIFGLGRRPIIDHETIDWVFETFEWLLRNFGGNEHFRGAVLVLPTDAFFPIEKGLSGHELAEAIFSHVKRHAGMEEWPCKLVPQEPDPDPVIGPGQVLQGIEPAPAGTFSVTGDAEDAVTITYDQALVADPMSLVATLSHELSHFLLATAPTLPPGEEELLEFTTDLTSVFQGFGVFMANSHFRFEQYADAFSLGWSSRRQGYMTERQLLFSLAIFSQLLGLHPPVVTEHLKPSLKRLYGRAVATVSAEQQRLEVLRSVVDDHGA